jgi:hypothetical protein
MGILLKIEMPWVKNSRLKKEAAEKKQMEELVVAQREIGLALTDTFKAAAARNTVYNAYPDGNCESSIKPIVVQTLADNGSRFTIVTTLPCKEVACVTLSVKGYPLHQIDIDFSRFGEELHFLDCPYGPEFFWDIDRLDDFSHLMTEKLKKYRHFPSLV